MFKSELGTKILNQIKNHRLAPRPRWYFQLKYISLLVFLLFFSILGILATSILIYTWGHSDWTLYGQVGNFWQTWLAVTPYLWLILLLSALVGSYWNFKHSRHGYRYSAFKILALIVGLSFFMGFTAYALGLNLWLDKTLTDKISWYNNLSCQRGKILVQPEKGLLAGVIQSRPTTDKINLQTFDNQFWMVTLEKDLINNPIFSPQKSVVLQGIKDGISSFRATRAGEWSGHCNCGCPHCRMK